MWRRMKYDMGTPANRNPRKGTYVVWCPDLGQEQEDGATVPAADPADAAEGWAEWHDRSSAEYRIASGREEIVIVRDVETGEQREWIVRGEAMPWAPLALIAAAPDLLSALVAAVELIETISPIEGDTVRHARSAIAKAVGHNA